MENIICKINLTDDKKLDIYVCTVSCDNKTHKELSFCVYGENNFQLDADLDESEIDSLIKYLIDCKNYISEYNSK